MSHAAFSFGSLGGTTEVNPPLPTDPEWSIWVAWRNAADDPTSGHSSYKGFKDNYCVQSQKCVKTSDGQWTLAEKVYTSDVTSTVISKKMGGNMGTPQWETQVAAERKVKADLKLAQNQLAALQAQLAAAQAAGVAPAPAVVAAAQQAAVNVASIQAGGRIPIAPDGGRIPMVPGSGGIPMWWWFAGAGVLGGGVLLYMLSRNKKKEDK